MTVPCMVEPLLVNQNCQTRCENLVVNIENNNYTPPKTNMAPKNRGLEDVPFPRDSKSIFCSFQPLNISGE